MIHNAWLMSINAKFNRYINGLSSMLEFTYCILSDIMKTYKRISYEFQVTPAGGKQSLAWRFPGLGVGGGNRHSAVVMSNPLTGRV